MAHSNYGLDFKSNTITITGGPTILSLTTERFIGATFHNLDATNIIYIGKSDVLSGGANGFGLNAGDMVEWRMEGDLNTIYAVAGGGSNLKLSWVIFK